MRMTALIAMFLGCYVLYGCDDDKQSEPNASQDALAGKGGSAQLSALTVDEAENFVQSWCGSGVLTNVRKLDADEYLVSADMPSWLNVVKTDQMDSGLADDETGRRYKGFVAEELSVSNAMLPTGSEFLLI